MENTKLNDNNKKDCLVLMIVFNKIQHDARVIRAAEAVAELGENVCVVSCNSDTDYKNNRFQSKTYQSGRKGPFLLICFWVFVVRLCLKQRKKIKCLYMHDYYMPFIGLLVSTIIKKKWIYDAHELLIQRNTHKYSKRELFFLLLEKYSIKKADLVIAANEERARIIKYIYKLKNVIFVQNISKYETLKEPPLKEDIIVYQGIMSEERSVSNYIKRLKSLPSGIKLKLIGDGPDLGFYEKIVSELNLSDRVVFTGKVSYDELRKESCMCRIGVVSYLMDDLNNYYCSPNKLFEYVQLQIPVIVSPQPFLVKIVRKYGIGEVLPVDCSEHDYQELVLKMIGDNLTYMGNMNRLLSDFSYEKEMEKMKLGVRKILCCGTDQIKSA